MLMVFQCCNILKDTCETQGLLSKSGLQLHARERAKTMADF